MRKLGELNAMSIKAGDTVCIYGSYTKVTSVSETAFGRIEIETENFGKANYNPIQKIDIYF